MANSFKQFLLSIMLLIPFVSMAQEHITSFGVTVKPMISGSFINESDPSTVEQGIEYSVSKLTGYSAGMVIRHNFTKLFAIETGLGFTRRNYNMKVTDPSNDYAFERSYGVVAYEIPIQALVYIQLSKEIFMDVSFGIVADLYPSDVAVFSDSAQVIMEGKRNGWFQGALTANIGWEWRTESAGAFYLGGTYHRSFADNYGMLMQYEYDASNPNTTPTTILNTTNGNYLTIDLRYFFHVNQKEQLERRKKLKEQRMRRRIKRGKTVNTN